jgi:hypothetical protein
MIEQDRAGFMETLFGIASTEAEITTVIAQSKIVCAAVHVAVTHYSVY